MPALSANSRLAAALTTLALFGAAFGLDAGSPDTSAAAAAPVAIEGAKAAPAWTPCATLANQKAQAAAAQTEGTLVRAAQTARRTRARVKSTCLERTEREAERNRATVQTAPAPTPAPTPTPNPTGMIVGLDAGNYGSSGAAEVRGAVNTVRYEADRGVSGLTAYENAGLKVQLNFAGPYNTGGVCALNAAAWAAETLNYYKTNTTPAQTPVIEALNEPGGTWFWGPNAANAANATCYRNLLKATYTAFHAQYGAAAPKLLGTLDGSGGLAFGKAWLTSDWASYVDGFIVHPYGGTGSKTSSAQGNHALIEQARAMTGGPVYITEIGWPTAVGQAITGDSLQWSEAEQAANITEFIAWCKGTGYVAEVIYFNYRDYGSNMWYGVLRGDGSRKPAYTALREAALRYGA